MNVLILSCGTRCLLVDYFKKKENGFNQVVVTDCSLNAPALYRADKYYIVPPMCEPSYLSFIFKICETEKINMVLPLHEDELLLIAEHNGEFVKRNIVPIVSPIGIIQLCRDKYSLYNRMKEIGIPVLYTGLIGEKKQIIEEYGFPLFMKPRYGAGSISSLVINKEKAIDGNVENDTKEFVIQPYIDGEEYGVNFYVDIKSGELIDVFVMKKIRMRAGETEKSISIHETTIERMVKKICDNILFRGPIDMDVIKKGNEYFVLDINPRFGGGYPHTHSCGVNFVKKLANNAKGIRNVPGKCNYKEGLIALRYMDISVIGKDTKADE